jgi:hypothetical protein
MNAFIIPMIHPNHGSISDYSEILNLLRKTLHSIKNQRSKVIIVVICHRIPSWHQEVKKFTVFIRVNSILFDLHHRLDYLTFLKNSTNSDDDTHIKEILADPASKTYLSYLSLGGQYHNKDKGLKYYLGLLYLFKYCKQHPIKYVGLVDGDDFFHHNLTKYLERNSGADLYVVQRGYLLFSESINSQKFTIQDYYPIRKFSSICGSNRVFLYSKLNYLINRRLHTVINNQNLTDLFRHRAVDEPLISDIMVNVKLYPNAWSILPNFLGTHRLSQANSENPIHPFQDKFSIQTIPFRAAIKTIHSHNHSYTNPSAKQELINRYQENGVLETTRHPIPDIHKLTNQFSIKTK